MTIAELEARMETLEKEVAHLKSVVERPKEDGQRSWFEDTGRFGGDRLFEEMVRFGREYRESQRPRARRRSK